MQIFYFVKPLSCRKRDFLSFSNFTGLDTMRKYRQQNRRIGKDKKSPRKSLKTTDICSGPSKLCQALNITKHNLNGIDMATDKHFYLLDDNFIGSRDQETKESHDQITIVNCKRIGISGYGEESANKLYRFYMKGNRNVSVVDKMAETKP